MQTNNLENLTAMERLLHYVWKHKMLPLRELETTDGRLVEIVDPGLYNRLHAGPDFFNANPVKYLLNFSQRKKSQKNLSHLKHSNLLSDLYHIYYTN